MTKRRTLLHLMLTLALSSIALNFLAAQSDYRPMLEITRFRWINGWYDNYSGKELNYLYDTLVENRQLKVYYFHHEKYPYQNGNEYFREDIQQRKVWLCSPGNNSTPYSESLLYDFSHQVGDTLLFQDLGAGKFKLEYVHHIDSIQLLDGQYRRIRIYRWWEGTNDLNLNGNYPLYDLVEGIGNLYMPFFSDARPWDVFTPICAWRGEEPVAGACEVAQINCDAITIDSILIITSNLLQVFLSYGQADWPIHAFKLRVLGEDGDTLALSLFTQGHINPNHSLSRLISTTQAIEELPDVVKVIIIDQLINQQCELLYGTTGLHDVPVSESLRVYPNPTAGEFQVELPLDFVVDNILLFDAHGRPHIAATYNDRTFVRISTSNLTTGVYSLFLIASDGSRRSARVVVTGR